MSRLYGMLVCVILFSSVAHTAHCAGGGLFPGSGNLLRGTVYKQNGVAREGVVVVTTSWNLPAVAPEFRYDFDILYGRMEDNLYTYQMADVAEMVLLPPEGGSQPVNLKLRNGLLQSVVLSSDRKGILGKMNLQLKEVRVYNEGVGESIISGPDVARITFSLPPALKDESMSSLADAFGTAVSVGRDEGILDKDIASVLSNIQKKMKAKLEEEKARTGR